MQQKNNRGFTLLELLIALSTTALLLLIIASAMMMGYRSEEKATERTELSQMERILAERLKWLLKGIYPYTRVTHTGPRLYFAGSSDSISFVTTSTLRDSDSLLEQSGMKWVRLYLDSDELKATENFFFLKDVEERGGISERTLFKGITEIEFQYLDTTESEKGTWYDSWSSEEKDYLPSAIKVKIKIEYREEEVQLPPIIVKVMPRRKAI
jgi:general secretion pathway protein J